MRRWGPAVLGAGLLLPGAAAAQTVAGGAAWPLRGFDVGVSASTLGAGVEAGIRPNDWLGFRAGANFLDFDFSRSIDNVHYTFDNHLRSGGAVVDFYPFRRGLRLTAGLRIDGNNADATGTAPPGSTVTINGTTYPGIAVGTINGRVDFNDVAPYAGFGYAGQLGGGFELALDLGVLYQGQPKVTLAATGPISVVPSFQFDLAAEQSRVSRRLDFLEWYPVVALTLAYRF